MSRGVPKTCLQVFCFLGPDRTISNHAMHDRRASSGTRYCEILLFLSSPTLSITYMQPHVKKETPPRLRIAVPTPLFPLIFFQTCDRWVLHSRTIRFVAPSLSRGSIKLKHDSSGSALSIAQSKQSGASGLTNSHRVCKSFFFVTMTLTINGTKYMGQHQGSKKRVRRVRSIKALFPADSEILSLCHRLYRTGKTRQCQGLPHGMLDAVASVSDFLRSFFFPGR